jgi:hypothetical protein
MTIKSTDEYIAAPKTQITNLRTASRTSVAAQPFSVFDLAGQPGAGVLNPSVLLGFEPINGATGYPLIPGFAPGKAGALGSVDFGNTVASRISLYDVLWHGGAYAFNANSSGHNAIDSARNKVSADWVGSTSFAAGDIVVNGTNAYICVADGVSASSGGPTGTGTAISDGSCVWNYLKAGKNYSSNELWVEAVTAFTGTPSFNVTYVNEAGSGGRSTGTVSAGAALTVGRMLRLPLQASDGGIKYPTAVTATVATAGTFNLLVMRRLWSGRVRAANDGDIHGPDLTGMPPIFGGTGGSAIRTIVTPDGTATGSPEANFTVVSG